MSCSTRRIRPSRATHAIAGCRVTISRTWSRRRMKWPGDVWTGSRRGMRRCPGCWPSGSAPRQSMSGGSGPRLSLTAGEYAFAVGGDGSTRTSRLEATSGVILARAEQVLRARCMARRGFRYTAVAPPATTDLPSVTGYPSTFYPNPQPTAYPERQLLALRRRQGFDLPAGHGETDPNERYLATVSPARQNAWRRRGSATTAATAPPRSSCSAAAPPPTARAPGPT